MGLFTDGTISSIPNLTDQDSGVLDVSNVEGINLTTKLALATEEIGIELSSLFQRYRTNFLPMSGVSPLDLEHVVITTPIRLWHTYQTLTLVYRDAYYNQLNDRYKGKWDQYRALAKWAQAKLIEAGVGLVFDPAPQPGAPILTPVAGGGAGGTFFVRISFLNGKGEESTPSAVASADVPAGYSLSIATGGAPSNVSGWNVYAGSDPAQVSLQNRAPLDLSATWTYSQDLAISGRAPGPGQPPNYTRALPRTLQRG